MSKPHTQNKNHSFSLCPQQPSKPRYFICHKCSLTTRGQQSKEHILCNLPIIKSEASLTPAWGSQRKRSHRSLLSLRVQPQTVPSPGFLWIQVKCQQLHKGNRWRVGERNDQQELLQASHEPYSNTFIAATGHQGTVTGNSVLVATGNVNANG